MAQSAGILDPHYYFNHNPWPLERYLWTLDHWVGYCQHIASVTLTEHSIEHLHGTALLCTIADSMEESHLYLETNVKTLIIIRGYPFAVFWSNSGDTQCFKNSPQTYVRYTAPSYADRFGNRILTVAASHVQMMPLLPFLRLHSNVKSFPINHHHRLPSSKPLGCGYSCINHLIFDKRSHSITTNHKHDLPSNTQASDPPSSYRLNLISRELLCPPPPWWVKTAPPCEPQSR